MGADVNKGGGSRVVSVVHEREEEQVHCHEGGGSTTCKKLDGPKQEKDELPNERSGKMGARGCEDARRSSVCLKNAGKSKPENKKK